MEFGLHNPDKSFTVGMYDASGDPVAAFRLGKDISCGSGVFSVGQDNTTVSAWYRSGLAGNQRWVLRPMDRAGELMLGTKADFEYGNAFVGNDSPNQSFFTANWIVDRFSGFASLVDVKAGTATKIQSLPGAPPGEYDYAVISGSAVFVKAFTDRSSWFVVENGVAKPFLGGANVDIQRLGTDGKWIVWNEGTQLIPDPADPSRVIAQRHDLYRTPFTTDASKIQRQLLVPDSPDLAGIATYANGYFTDISLSRPDGSTTVHSQAFVVKVDTGRAWTSDLPQGYSWGSRNYPTGTELWGAVGAWYDSAYMYTVARVPYADMTQTQAAMP